MVIQFLMMSPEQQLSFMDYKIILTTLVKYVPTLLLVVAPLLLHMSVHTITVRKIEFYYLFENTIVAPVGPPRSVTANRMSTGLHLYWEAPFDPDSLIISYTIRYQLMSTHFAIATPRPEVTISMINDTNYFLQFLLVSSTYKITVTAVTNESTGPMSEPLITRTNPSGTYA